MHRKRLALLILTAFLVLPGCSAGQTDQTEENSGEGSARDITIETDSGEGEEADEQETGEMQEKADAIDALHADADTGGGGTGEDGAGGAGDSGTPVEQADWEGQMLTLAQSEEWTRTSSGEQEGGFAEVYDCDGRLEYTWSCTALSSGTAEGGDMTDGDTADGGDSSGENSAEGCLAERGWTVSAVTADAELSEKTGMEAYGYTAYEDDEGYSMLHRGVILTGEDMYYTADFRMMEGDMGTYEASVQEWLAEISLS